MTPYELGILLDVYCGRELRANPAAPIFEETVASLCADGWMREYAEEEVRPAGHRFVRSEKLRVFIDHVLQLPAPVWRMP